MNSGGSETFDTQISIDKIEPKYAKNVQKLCKSKKQQQFLIECLLSLSRISSEY